MCVKKKYLVVVFLTLLLATTTPASAWIAGPWKSTSPHVKYKLDPSMNWSSTVSNAAASWNNAIPMQASMSYDANAPYTIFKVNKSWEEWSGYTKPYSVMGVYWTQLYTEINSYQTDTANSYTWTQKQGLIAHEMGHAFGLNDDDGYLLFGSPICLMIGHDSVRHSLGVYGPQSDDVAGVKAIHGL